MMLPGSSSNGRPRLASFAAAALRFFSLSASRLARALARSSALELVICVFPEGRALLRHHRPRMQAIQFPETPVQEPRRRGVLDTRSRGHDTETWIEPRACRGRNFDRHRPEGRSAK